MSNTKKNFLRAGGIIAIIMSVLAIMASLLGIFAMKYVTMDLLKEAFTQTEGVTVIDNGDNTYDIQITEKGVVVETLSYEDLKDLVNTVVGVMKTAFIIVLLGEIAIFVVSIILLKDVGKRKVGKGIIITELVLNLLLGDLLTAIFMIVALCLKDKQPTLENINEFAK